MSDPMIAGGNSGPAITNGVRRGEPADATSAADDDETAARGVAITAGLG